MPKDDFQVPRAFPRTVWGDVHLAGAGDNDALGQIYNRYKAPLIACLIFKLRLPADQAEELFQNFTGDKVIRQNCIARANPAKGKFRNFLLTALVNHAISTLRQNAPGTIVSLDEAGIEMFPADPQETESADWWTRSVIAAALQGVRTDYEVSGQSAFWTVFWERIVQPMLEDVNPTPFEELLHRGGFQSPQQVFNALQDAKRKFKRHLREVIDATDGNTDSTEINNLLKFL